MGREIERKFLLKSTAWRSAITRSTNIVQAYLSNDARSSVRVRIAGGKANINIKSANPGVDRLEFEYEIPIAHAEQMLATLARPGLIEKNRHLVPFAGCRWEIDEFSGDNAGLIIAEIELETVNAQFSKPPWLGAEVSHEARYYNAGLARFPYKNW